MNHEQKIKFSLIPCKSNWLSGVLANEYSSILLKVRSSEVDSKLGLVLTLRTQGILEVYF